MMDRSCSWKPEKEVKTAVNFSVVVYREPGSFEHYA